MSVNDVVREAVEEAIHFAPRKDDDILCLIADSLYKEQRGAPDEIKLKALDLRVMNDAGSMTLETFLTILYIIGAKLRISLTLNNISFKNIEIDPVKQELFDFDRVDKCDDESIAYIQEVIRTADFANDDRIGFYIPYLMRLLDKKGISKCDA